MLLLEKKSIQEALEVIQALREYVQAIPSDVVLPTMPGVSADWMDEVESTLQEQLKAPSQVPVATVKPGTLCNRMEWVSDDVMQSTPVGAKLYANVNPAEPN